MLALRFFILLLPTEPLRPPRRQIVQRGAHIPLEDVDARPVQRPQRGEHGMRERRRERAGVAAREDAVHDDVAVLSDRRVVLYYSYSIFVPKNCRLLRAVILG